MSALGSALEETIALERRRASRALLLHPVLVAGGRSDAEFRLVRKHAAFLREWFDVNAGWWLSDDIAVARLHKRVEGDDPTRGLPESSQPFSRRRYVLFALALSVLERSGVQTTLGALAADVVTALGDGRFARAGIEFTLHGRDQRSDLASAVRLLLDLGVLRRIDGEEARFVEGAGDVLYDVERRVLAVLLTTAVAPSSVDASEFEERLARITARPTVETDEARNRAVRRSITRRLLDDPVLYFADLDEQELAYWASQRRALTDRVEEITGLVAEVRAEGVAMVDPDDRLTDLRMPERGTAGHLALLIATALAGSSRLSRPTLARLVRRLQREHVHHWSKAVAAERPDVLAADAVDRLVGLRLARIDSDDVVALPAIGRYRVGSVRMEGAA